MFGVMGVFFILAVSCKLAFARWGQRLGKE